MAVWKQLLASKKFMTAVLGIVLSVVTAMLPAAVVTDELKANLILVITILCGVAVGGQAIADVGKESEKIRDSRERDAAKGDAEVGQ